MPSVQSVETTPILNSGVLPPRRPKKRILGIVIGIFIGLIFAVLVDNIGHKNLHGVFPLFSFYAGLILAVTIHELGHLTAGWLVGFHFSLISLGPFLLQLEYGQLKVRIRNLGALGYAGMHIDTVARLRKKLLIYISAGPAANLISAVVAAPFLIYPSHSLQNSWLISFIAGFAMLSLITCFLSLLPYGKTLRSDGARIRMLLNSPIQTRRWISALALSSQQRKGIRAKAWKQSWLKAICAIRDQSSDEIFGNTLSYIAASDRKDENTAATYLERCLELAPSAQPTSRDFMVREAAYFCAWAQNDLPLAEKWFAQINNPTSTTRLLQFRSSVAFSVARNDFDTAIADWQKGRDFISHLPETQLKNVLQQSWQEWGDEVRLRCNRHSEPAADLHPTAQ